MLLGTLSLIPLLAIQAMARRNVERLDPIACWVAIVVSLAALPAAPAAALGLVWLSTNPKVTRTRQELAEVATRLRHEKTGPPLAYFGGSYAYGGAVAFHSSDRPHGFYGFDYCHRQWVKPRDFADHGLLSVCVVDEADCLAATANFVTPISSQTELILARRFWGHEADTVRIIMTMAPPRGRWVRPRRGAAEGECRWKLIVGRGGGLGERIRVVYFTAFPPPNHSSAPRREFG